MLFDMTNDLGVARGVSPAAAVTDNTAFVSQILDVQGKYAVNYLILTGSLADADATFTVLVEHGDAANLSDAAAVADEDLILTEASAGFTFALDDSVQKIGYRGSKRYVRVTVTPANNTGNAFVAGVWTFMSERNPVDQL